MKLSKPLLILACTFASRSALPASPVESTFERLVAVCGEMRDATARVACFDREIAPFRKAPTKAPVAASAPVPPAPAPAPKRSTAPKDLGAEELAKPSSRAAKTDEAALTARITAIRVVDASASLVTLDNGQVWRNEDARRAGYLTEGASVTIRKASFGSYRLTMEGGDSRNWISVTRVR